MIEEIAPMSGTITATKKINHQVYNPQNHLVGTSISLVQYLQILNWAEREPVANDFRICASRQNWSKGFFCAYLWLRFGSKNLVIYEQNIIFLPKKRPT